MVGIHLKELKGYEIEIMVNKFKLKYYENRNYEND